MDPIIWPKEFNREVIDSLAAEDSPYISEIYFVNEGKGMRWVQYERDGVRTGDFDIDLGKFDGVRKAERYEDRGIYKYGLTYVQHHDTLAEFVRRQEDDGGIIGWPEKDFENLIVLEKDGSKEYFLVYDIFNERIKRKIGKPKTQKSVFAVHHEAEYLVYANGKSIVMYSLLVPDDIDDFIKPIYYSRDHQRNPAKIVKEKDKLCNKIMSLLKLYNKKKRSKKFLIRIRKMMYKCFDMPVLLSYNNAFLTLYKTLIQDEKEWERIDIIKLHKTMVFNEIKFSNDLHKIRNISLPSNPSNNYLLLSIDGVIYKYDISTKELLFSFKASAYRAMQIYDNDQKILTCDSNQVKIWSFDNDNTELLTSLPIEDKIEKFYAPKETKEKAKLVYVGVFQGKPGFKVYKDKLSEYWQCKDGIHVTCCDFTQSWDAFIAGTTEGSVVLYEFKDKSKVGDVAIGDSSAIKEIWILDDKYVWVATEEPSVYVCPLGNASKLPNKLQTNPNKIMWMKTSWERSMVIIGFEDNTIEFWKYRGNEKLEMLKEIKEDFYLFDVDSLCSSMLILNPQGRDFEYHIIEWEWDTTAIEKDLQNINLDLDNLKAEDLNDSDSEQKMKKYVSDGKGKKRSQTACCTIF